MKNFLWCSPHQPTAEQLSSLQNEGEVVFLKDVAPALMERLGDTPRDRQGMFDLALEVQEVAIQRDAKIVQLGGSPAFLFVAGAAINSALSKGRIIFADSERVSEDQLQPDGSVRKVSIFRHRGWI